MNGICFVLVLLFVAGCTKPEPISIERPVPQSVPEPWSGHIVHKIPFQLGPGIEIAGMELTNVTSGPFPVAPNANDLYAEARWTCTTPLCDLTMELHDGHGDKEAGTIGSNHTSVRLRGPVEGNWSASIGAANVLLDAKGEIRVSVFYNQLVDPAYTAFGG